MTLYKISNQSGAPQTVQFPGHPPIPMVVDGTFNINLALPPAGLPSGVVAEQLTDGVPNSFEALAEAIGTPQDLPWNGTDPAASLISIMKAVAKK